MPIYGNEAAGFEIVVDRALGQLGVRAWGFWTPSLAESYPKEIARHCAGFGGMDWRLVADFQGYLPQRNEAQEAQEKAMTIAASYNMNQASFIVTNAITRMQLRRLLGTYPEISCSFYTSKEEAEQLPSRR